MLLITELVLALVLLVIQKLEQTLNKGRLRISF